MRHPINPEVARLIEHSRKDIETSRRIVAQSRRDLETLRAEIEESWRMLEALGGLTAGRTATPARVERRGCGTGVSRRAGTIMP